MSSSAKSQEITESIKQKTDTIKRKTTWSGPFNTFQRRNSPIPTEVSPWHEIVSYAVRVGAGLIVIGSRGQGKLKRTILGSVSDSVLHHSDIPVLMVNIHSSLSMMLLGARGFTAYELAESLGLTHFKGTVHQIYRELKQQYKAFQDVSIYSVTALFINPYAGIFQKFIQDASVNYFASVRHLDMIAEEGSEKAINDLVAAGTDDMILEVLASGNVTESTNMVLVSAFCFNGSWLRTFDKSKTRSEEFHMLDGNSSQVDMMHDNRHIKIKNVTGMDIVELPFRGGRFSMYIVLPHAGDGITDLEILLAQPDKIDHLFADLHFARVHLAIPKFRAETSFVLNSALKNLGITSAFSPVAADFTGITQSDVFLSQAVHTSVIDVQEAGTTSAACDAYLSPGQLRNNHPPKQAIIADHPFVYFIRDSETGQILLHGKFSG
ncbi:Serpin B6 [Bulinus truncatus]|nr:Serpin B6 [Bulinus truncatus]